MSNSAQQALAERLQQATIRKLLAANRDLRDRIAAEHDQAQADLAGLLVKAKEVGLSIAEQARLADVRRERVYELIRGGGMTGWQLRLAADPEGTRKRSRDAKRRGKQESDTYAQGGSE